MQKHSIAVRSCCDLVTMILPVESPDANVAAKRPKVDLWSELKFRAVYYLCKIDTDEVLFCNRSTLESNLRLIPDRSLVVAKQHFCP